MDPLTINDGVTHCQNKRKDTLKYWQATRSFAAETQLSHPLPQNNSYIGTQSQQKHEAYWKHPAFGTETAAASPNSAGQSPGAILSGFVSY